MPLAVSAYEAVLAVHIVAVVIAFGWIFALPIVFAAAARQDPRSLPLLHRVELLVSRWLVNPALTVVVGAGVFLASDGDRWSEFFVQWGVGAAIVLGGLVGSVLMPASRRAEAAARADLEAHGGDAFLAGEDYRRATRTLTIAGSATAVLVLVTIVLMVVKP